jgi:hypothetical protein
MFNLGRSKHRSRCKSVVVTTATGKVYDLGSPSSLLFWFRVQIYKLQRMIHG